MMPRSSSRSASSPADDDAEERVLTRAMSRWSSDLELINDNGDDQIVGMRFTGVEVPRRATITSAWIQFQVDENIDRHHHA